jgi:hypothetical protein
MLAAGLVVWLPARPSAHEIPSDVTIRMFLRTEGTKARLLVRAPLEAMTDIDWPLVGPGLLNMARVEPFLRDASTLWLADNLSLYEADTKLPYPTVVSVRASLPSDRSFDSYEQALAHVMGPRLPDDTELDKNQGLLDVLFEIPIRSDRSLFSIDMRFERLGQRVLTVLRFQLPSGVERAFEMHGNPGLVLLDPRWFQAAWRFVVEGFFHILDGIDHLLFLFCLVIPFRRLRVLVPIVTAFTLAHSVTLIASAYGMAPGALWFPPLVETLIATSIVYMSLENIVGARRSRWLITFGFGLIHGFGFSFALRETLQFAGAHLITSLLAFNVGVELGQLVVLVLVVPVLELLFRFGVAERTGIIILSALVAHTGWHWMTDRFSLLSQYQFEMPAFDAAFFAAFLRWVMVVVAAAGLAWLVFGVLFKSAGRGDDRATASAEQ